MPPKLWLTSDLGTADMLTLFTSPNQWATVRSKVSVYKFFTEQTFDFGGSPPGYIGQNTMQNIAAAGGFSRLTAWGIGSAIEAGVIAVPDGAWDPVAATLNCIGNVVNHGGPLPLLDCDTTRGRGVSLNGFTQAQTVARFKTWCDAIHAAYPTIQIGDIEPIFGAGDGTTLNNWIDACLAAGVPLKWVTVDTTPTPTARAEVAAVIAHCHGLIPPLPVQVVINPGIPSSITATDAEFCTTAMNAASALAGAITNMEVLEVQSWYTRSDLAVDRSVPLNLPESANSTLTNLAGAVANLFGVAVVTPPPSGGGPQPVAVDGTWSYPVSALVAGEVLAATQSSGGTTSAPSNSVIVQGNAPPAAPILTGIPYHAGEVTVTGTGVAGAILALFINGVLNGTTTVGGDGTWSKPVPALTQGQVLTASQTTAGGTSALSSPTSVLAAIVVTPPVNTGYLLLAGAAPLGDLLLAGGTDALLLTGGNKLKLSNNSRLVTTQAVPTGDLLLATGDALLVTGGNKLKLTGGAFSGVASSDPLLLTGVSGSSAGRVNRTTDLSATGRRGRSTEH